MRLTILSAVARSRFRTRRGKVRRSRALASPLCAAASNGRFGALSAIAGMWLAAVACQCGARKPDPPNAEQAWLDDVGRGPSQTAKVCARGARDRIATTLCARPSPDVSSLGDLYRALGVGKPEQRLVAATTHSLGLSARTVSAANPRAFVFEHTSKPDLAYEEVFATSFARGEQFVEMVGLDPATYEYNFYLLRFEQACNASRCTPEDLLGPDIEEDWTAWTLYSDSDLEDTPLDCVSCHLPFGAGTHKLLLMRQVLDPWMHWGDFRGGDERALCPDPPADGGSIVAKGEGLDVLASLEGAKDAYAGVPVAELHAAKSGDVFTSFLVNAEQRIRMSPYGDYPYEQLSFQTREVLCERFRDGTSPTWDEARARSLSRGLPVPFYGPDVLDPAKREELLGGKDAFLQRRESEDPFEVAASLLSDEVSTAVGFVPRQQDSAEEILQSMCVRCHASGVRRGLRRARFDVTQASAAITPETYRKVVERLRLPETSPELMPPRRFGELPPWAITRIEEYLAERCTVPNGCD